jgi:hypothetical protein
MLYCLYVCTEEKIRKYYYCLRNVGSIYIIKNYQCGIVNKHATVVGGGGGC